ADRRLHRWQAADSRRAPVCRALQRGGIEIDYIHETEDQLVWGLFVQIPQAMAEIFCTRRGVLFWGHFRTNSTTAALHEAFALFGSEQVRLSREVLIVFCLNSAIVKELNDAAANVQTTVAVLPESALYNCRPQGSTELIDILRPRLYSRDLYDHKLPVT